MDAREERFLSWLEKIWRDFLRLLAALAPGTRLTLTTKEGIMADYQLDAGDSVVVTITDTDEVTGEAVVPDEGSVAAELSSDTDSFVLDPSGSFLTLTAGATPGTGNSLTVTATVGGVASSPAVGTYDVVSNVAPPNPTALSLTFGVESAPAGDVADDAPADEPAPRPTMDANGQVIPSSQG